MEPVKYMPAYPAVVPGFFNPEVEIFRGFWMVTWFKEEFACKEIKKAKKKGIAVEAVMDKMLKKSEPGSHGLIVQPYWSPGLNEPSAKGAMIGFGDVHKKPHVYRAVIEGLTFALKEGLEKIEKVSGKKVRKLAVSGGASQSDEICQITADVFNLPVVRGKTAETSGLGAAVLVALGTGQFTSLEQAIEKMVSHQDEFYPDIQHVDTYHELYRKVYRKIFKKLGPLYHEIRKITGYPD
jgi:sugar (pentulose or hexulose) kinase